MQEGVKTWAAKIVRKVRPNSILRFGLKKWLKQEKVNKFHNLKNVQMPFKSKSQQAACYSTKGFGGKVDCAKWSKMTNQKALPKKVTKKRK
jgi:hypothetical protein